MSRKSVTLLARCQYDNVCAFRITLDAPLDYFQHVLTVHLYHEQYERLILSCPNCATRLCVIPIAHLSAYASYSLRRHFLHVSEGGECSRPATSGANAIYFLPSAE